MTWLWNTLWSFMPVSDWRATLEKHGLVVALVGGCLCLFGWSLHFFGYEIAIPVRDEFIAFVREVRANNGDLTKAKLSDSVTLAKLVRLLELREGASGEVASHQDYCE